jgi:hypothetical protein
MKRAFIRAVYGNIDIERKHNGLHLEIPRILENPYNEEYITYVWGDENEKMLNSWGIKCRKVSSDAFPYDIAMYKYKPKLDAYYIAMNDDGYDEIVFLDWDMVPTKKLPLDFWETLGKKEVIQGPLYGLKHRMCKWREVGATFMIQASFLYIRDKSIPDKLNKVWEQFPDTAFWRGNDERCISKYIDDINGGWIGVDKWWDLYEPMVCHLDKKSVYAKNRTLMRQKNICFMHLSFTKWPRPPVAQVAQVTI